MTNKPKLKIDIRNAEGSVVFPDAWNDVCPLKRMDILKDLIYDMEIAYRKARDDFKKTIS